MIRHRPHTPALLYSILLLLQWPASILIQYISLTVGVLTHEYLVILGISLLAWQWSKTPAREMFPFLIPCKQDLLWLLLSIIPFLILIEYLTFLTELVWTPSMEVKSFLEKILTVQSFPEGLWRWFLIALTPAICEEFFFRGYFQSSVGKFWGPKAGLILTAIAFALIHGIPQYFHLYFLLGLYLGWLLLTTRNLLFPILAHLFNNSWTFLLHLFDFQIPRDGVWRSTDTLVLLISLAACYFLIRRAPSLTSA